MAGDDGHHNAEGQGGPGCGTDAEILTRIKSGGVKLYELEN